ncbi:hypothetical protein [Pullulanibacillus camelliae]|uniref:hypothetical protein n=1 Tax=Pullulanibacillus camelliae TaxID=1707096 RepID=UPI00166DB814|nr:hypothetical protein [Pullulanibacillus camelliae]
MENARQMNVKVKATSGTIDKKKTVKEPSGFCRADPLSIKRVIGKGKGVRPYVRKRSIVV